MKYVGAGLELGTAATVADETVATIVQQDGADPGRTEYRQFTGDPDPSSPVRGDVRIVQS